MVETVSAGGGSIAWVDDGGALRVGPHSAGAVPGPVAFARGGTKPTVTDAHVALKRITGARMSGGVSLDVCSQTLGSGRDVFGQTLDGTFCGALGGTLGRLRPERDGTRDESHGKCGQHAGKE